MRTSFDADPIGFYQGHDGMENLAAPVFARSFFPLIPLKVSAHLGYKHILEVEKLLSSWLFWAVVDKGLEARADIIVEGCLS